MTSKTTAFLITTAMAAAILTGCDKQPPPDPCEINPTYQDIYGEWREADGEPLDDDPCDADDLNDDGLSNPGKKKSTPLRKDPAPKRTRR